MARVDPSAKLFAHEAGARANRLDRWGMNRPDKPGELSIDEILASIRQNISEEPDAPQSALDVVAEASPPGVPSNAAAPPPPPETPPSLQDRLSGAFKSGPSAGVTSAGGTNGTKRPLPFDQDLADILDEPDAAGAARATPKPEMRVSPELGGSLGAQPLSVAESPAKPAGAAKASSSSPSDPAPSAPLFAPAPFGRAFADSAAAAPRPPQTFGFPPLTKRTGFYPPERPEPVLPPVRSDNLAKAQPSGSPLAPKDASPAPSSPGIHPASTTEPATRVPDFGSVVPSDVAGRGQPTPDSAFGAPPRVGAETNGGVNGRSLGLPQLEPSAPASPTLSAPGVPNLTVPEPVTTRPSFSAKPDETPLGAPSGARSPEPAPAQKPLGARATASVAMAPIGQDAAADALGALAQGLAASTAKSSDAARPVQERAEAPSAAVQAAAPVSAVSAAANAAALPPAPEAGAAAGRTLEDVVSDMLRPMLQKWVAENMPRIMEKALRSEMQRTLGSGGGTKPPGS